MYLQESLLQKHLSAKAAVSLPNHPQNSFKSLICAAGAGENKSRQDFCILCKLGSDML